MALLREHEKALTVIIQMIDCDSSAENNTKLSINSNHWLKLSNALPHCTSRRTTSFSLRAECRELRRDRINTMATLLKPQRSACNWHMWVRHDETT